MTSSIDTAGPALRRWAPLNVGIALVIALGASVIAYPSTAAWITDLTHAATVSGYARSTSERTPSERAALLGEARTFNEALPYGPLRDPYVLNEEGGSEDLGVARDRYESLLAERPGGPLARIRIPSIGVDLPVYHGTSEATLARGIGHLFGSGLPVGGAGTHSVLTGHSGFVGATLFTRLNELQRGDTFVVEAAGESFVYRVDQIAIVRPDEGDLLRRDPDKDLVTLLTCTPTGVNSHRLLVRGERVVSAEDAAEQIALAERGAAASVPWLAFAILLAGASLAVGTARMRVARRVS